MSVHEPTDDLPMDDIMIRIQALADNELPESEIEAALEAIQGSYAYRSEYAQLLRMRRRLGRGPSVRPSEDWLQKAEKRISRKVSRGLGTLLFIGSYVSLFGYALYTLIREPDVPIIVVVLIAGGVLGFVFLLGNAIADRVRESRNDRYREIIR